MSSLIDKDKSCEPSEGKKCKERKKHSEEVQRKDCVEPQPPPVVDKVLFDSDSADPLVQERAKCLKDCQVKPIYVIWKECDKRVTRKLLYTAETCHEETIDLMEAIDKCVQKSQRFLQLK